ncbi:MAG TPA: hypothetical protein VMJ66_02900 [Geobacteraceae bacterium]|nr:hypothetical protein [Geobacteraceae bacterium]
MIVFDTLVKDRLYLSSDAAGLWRSDNGGVSWKAVDEGLGNLNVAAVSPSPVMANLVYAATRSGLFVSSDGGEGWQECGDFAGGMSFQRPESYRIALPDPANMAGIFAGTADGKVLFSSDLCRSWSPLGQEANPFKRKTPISAIALTADKKYLLVGSAAGFARYSFTEKRWEADSLRKPVSDLVCSKKENALVWAASESELLASHDYGKSWSTIEKVAKGRITRVAIHETGRGGTISYLWENGWNGGLMISEDGGKLWRSADSEMSADALMNPTRLWKGAGGRSLSVAIDPFSPSHIFRTDWWGVWQSTNAGRSWREAINGTANTVCTDLLALENGDLLVATMDNGLLRRDHLSGKYEPLFPAMGDAPETNGHVWRVLSPDTTGKSLIATSSPWNEKTNQVILSGDSGRSFRRTRSGLPQARPRIKTLWGEGYPRALAIDPANNSNIYLGIDGEDGGGLFMSSDGGNTWSPAPAQPPAKAIYSGLAVDQLNPDILFWGSCGSIYRSPDRGRNWARVAYGCIFEIVCTKEGEIFAAGDHGGPVLLQSTDHGVTWHILKRFNKKGTAKGFSVNPINPAMMAVSVTQWNSRAAGSIHLSLDHGKTWKDISEGLPNGMGAAATTFSRDGKYLYIARYAGSVYRLALAEFR